MRCAELFPDVHQDGAAAHGGGGAGHVPANAPGHRGDKDAAPGGQVGTGE